jgi:ribosome-associated heat shock protein Hsp15
VKPTPEESPSPTRVRLDKWLWAARFYKTRSQSNEAIGAGHVKVAGERVKSGLSVHVGLTLELVKESVRWEIEVLALSEKRGKGADAALLYRETDEGKAKRIKQLEEMRQQATGGPVLRGRPTKRDRRVMIRFSHGRQSD